MPVQIETHFPVLLATWIGPARDNDAEQVHAALVALAQAAAAANVPRIYVIDDALRMTNLPEPPTRASIAKKMDELAKQYPGLHRNTWMITTKIKLKIILSVVRALQSRKKLLLVAVSDHAEALDAIQDRAKRDKVTLPESLIDELTQRQNRT